MPVYIYEHPKTRKRIEVMQGMNDPHIFVDDEGVNWNRVFVNPAAKVDSLDSCDPFSPEAFVKRTSRKGMTLGDMWDESSKMSEKRQSILGRDPVKEKAESAYTKRTGKPHPHAKKKPSRFLS